MDSESPSPDLVLAGTGEWFDRVVDAVDQSLDGTVRRVTTVGDALTACASAPPDCLVTADVLADGSGLDLLRAVRDEFGPDVPVVMYAAEGSESLASDAIRAGIDDYVPVPDGAVPPTDDIVERVRAVVGRARDRSERAARARQFDAVFRDAQTATWVLDADGALVRANGTARRMLDVTAESADDDALAGRPFWALPWWAAGEGVRSDIEHVVDRVADSGTARQLVTNVAGAGDTTVLQLSVHPVHRDGTLTGFVVEGVDVSEEVSLHRELRDSERLHRVTLNNMTDTVLVTDEQGAFTYVCPNVHFIFGYSAEEIREMGTIDELLGSDLFDRAELAAEGVLTNIETTATDKAGREHTLLVNVREVDISGGSLLFSCRDVTKRKRREEALRSLHSTTRELLYAGTKQEIAGTLVAETGEIVGLDATAMYLFDDDANRLRPAAASAAMTRRHGPLETLPVDDASLVGRSYLDDEAQFVPNVHDADAAGAWDPASDLHSVAVVPLGSHGVLLTASPEVDAFDSMRRELVDLVAATAEAALDRVHREAQLRERDRELQRRNEQLTRLNRINGLIRGIDRALVQAETREEIDRAVCETLSGDDGYEFAWVGERDATTGGVEPRAWAGEMAGYLDSVSLEATSSAAEPTGRTAATGEVTLISNVADELRADAWRREAMSRGFHSVVSVPLASGDFRYGVLSVYAAEPDAFDDTTRAVLAELGETVASAIGALERKRALLDDEGTRLEFSVRDPDFPFQRLAAQVDCTLSVRGGVQVTADGVAVFASVEGAAPAAVADAARGLVTVEDAQVVTDGEDGGVVKLTLSRPFVALTLADRGAVLRRIEADADGATLVVEGARTVDARTLVEHVEDSFAAVELVGRRPLDRPSGHDLAHLLFDRLTDRQLEVVRTAYYSGFFESPRQATGEDVAAALDISPPAFYRHNRTVQRKLFATLFEDVGVPVDVLT